MQFLIDVRNDDMEEEKCMNGDSIAVKCAIVRGGTSKAIFVMDNELPKDAESRKADEEI